MMKSRVLNVFGGFANDLECVFVVEARDDREETGSCERASRIQSAGRVTCWRVNMKRIPMQTDWE